MSQPNLLKATPLVHVNSSEAAEAFYGTQLGFTLAWQYRPQAPAADPGYLGFERDGVELHVSSFSGDGVVGGVTSFEVRDVDALYEEFKIKGVAFELPPCDQSWGNREMYLRDADGNSIRFIQPG
jgi:catechol 2,3-dioxygenase-like lactoylglutathione lyase family enzyme